MAGASSKLFVFALCAALSCGGAWAAPTEYEVKVAFIHNIAKFVEWPAVASPASGRARLCLLGDGPSGGAFEVLQGKPVGAANWEVVRVDGGRSLKECRVLFIASSERANLGRILARIEGSPVLTVGDTEGYAGQGVIVNFYQEENKVRFEINRDAAGRAGLAISSQLLKLARIVSGAEK
jgi:hypothetical protein